MCSRPAFRRCCFLDFLARASPEVNFTNSKPPQAVAAIELRSASANNSRSLQAAKTSARPLLEQNFREISECVYIYIYMYVCLFVCMMYVCMYVRTYACMHMYIIRMCICMCTGMCCTCICVSAYAYACAYVYYVYVYVYAYVYVNV